MSVRTKVVSIDMGDTILDSLADVIQHETNKILETIENEGFNVLSVQHMPLRNAYSEPEPGSYRDYHYTERGVMVIVTYTERPGLRGLG